MPHPAFLVVEDDPFLRLLLRRVIAAQYPYAPVCFATTLAETRQLLSSGVPTIVVTDYHLADGTGFDVLVAAQQHVPSASVVCVSGDSTVEHSIVAAGAAAFVAKPFDILYVEHVLRHLIPVAAGHRERDAASCTG